MRNISQLRAIKYQYTKQALETLERNNPDKLKLYEYQDQYRSLGGFLRSRKVNYKKIIEKLETRNKQELIQIANKLNKEQERNDN